MTPSFPIRLRPAAAPLAICGAVARGSVARELALRLLREPGPLDHLRACGAPGLLVLLAPETRLPWVDGIVFIGTPPGVPTLCLPTWMETEIDPATVERALRGHFQRGPLLLLEASGPTLPPLVIALDTARPLDRARLETWLAKDGA